MGGINLIIDPEKYSPMVVCTNIIKEEAEKNGVCSQGIYCSSRDCIFATKNK